MPRGRTARCGRGSTLDDDDFVVVDAHVALNLLLLFLCLFAFIHFILCFHSRYQIPMPGCPVANQFDSWSLFLGLGVCFFFSFVFMATLHIRSPLPQSKQVRYWQYLFVCRGGDIVSKPIPMTPYCDEFQRKYPLGYVYEGTPSPTCGIEVNVGGSKKADSFWSGSAQVVRELKFSEFVR